MTEAPNAKFFHRTLLSGSVALALLVGLAVSPTILARHADAQEITAAPVPVTPPQGSPMSFADLIDRVRPAVVSIQVRQRPDAQAEAETPEGLPPGFEEFFRGRPESRGPGMSLGSGFFIDENGTVVTNYHVIEGAEEITVKVSDGRELRAEIVGSDQPTDIAVLRIPSGGRFPFVRFDEDSDVRVGDWVVAVGNPFGLEGTATAGIVSAIGRRDAGSTAYVDYMQVDAPINRGNSGGPTFDLRGRVIGVNSAIFSPTGGNVGIGFAIPADTAARIVAQLQSGGRVSRGWIGVSIQPLDDDIARSLGLENRHGALVANVVADGPAARAGIQQGDVILKLDGHDIEDSRDLTQRVGATAMGRTSRVEILRGGARRTLNIQLAERPAEQTLVNNRTTPQPDATTPEGGAAQAALGASVRALTAEDRTRLEITAADGGLLVTAVSPDSDLAEKGVRPGDVILQAGGHQVRTSADLATATQAAQRANRPLLLQVQGRSGQRGYIAVEVGAG
ncbi:MAG: Do family serine endopeptidase [Terricaulis sp.]